MRKALQRGSVAGAERFDPVAVLSRDRWKCHLCGRATPQRLRGTYDDRAPELDHIVPLARGGKHTMANTACACRRCNIVKGARPLGQLRLLG
ncbi:HNH endonuclease [Sphingomonas sp. PB2P19]|uniref:HNH endonuclease n=1 Tax=Sphingomonas rhamnosi TaxID=3096156 RepID=UPI003FA6D1B1